MTTATKTLTDTMIRAFRTEAGRRRRKPVTTTTQAQREDDERRVSDGKDALRRQYYGNVRATAEEILKDAAERHGSFDEAQEWIEERIHEDADGSYWVIYTHAALDTIFASDNWLEIDEAGEPGAGDLTTRITQAACYALAADLRQQIEATKGDFWPEGE